MAAIQPTIGRVMLHSMERNSDYPEIPAVVVSGLVQKVNEDGTVNLLTSIESGYPMPARNLPVVQEGETAPEFAAYAFWMPYQVAQATEATAKTTAK